jgi:hypothetical protein
MLCFGPRVRVGARAPKAVGITPMITEKWNICLIRPWVPCSSNGWSAGALAVGLFGMTGRVRRSIRNRRRPSLYSWAAGQATCGRDRVDQSQAKRTSPSRPESPSMAMGRLRKSTRAWIFRGETGASGQFGFNRTG